MAELNRARVEDVLRIAGFATGASMERLEGAELLWVDRLGLYLLAAVRGEGAQARPWGYELPCLPGAEVQSKGLSACPGRRAFLGGPPGALPAGRCVRRGCAGAPVGFKSVKSGARRAKK